jgi:hypothetical protein
MDRHNQMGSRKPGKTTNLVFLCSHPEILRVLFKAHNAHYVIDLAQESFSQDLRKNLAIFVSFEILSLLRCVSSNSLQSTVSEKKKRCTSVLSVVRLIDNSQTDNSTTTAPQYFVQFPLKFQSQIKMAHALLPGVMRLPPKLGTPICFLVSSSKTGSSGPNLT